MIHETGYAGGPNDPAILSGQCAASSKEVGGDGARPPEGIAFGQRSDRALLAANAAYLWQVPPVKTMGSDCMIVYLWRFLGRGASSQPTRMRRSLQCQR